MNKKDYQIERKRISDEVQNLKLKRLELDVEYKKSNLSIPIGSKVKITIPEHTERYWNNEKTIAEEILFGFIKSYHIDYNDNVVYKFNRLKKDGTESQRELHIRYENSMIEQV